MLILDPTHSHLTKFQVKAGAMTSPTDSMATVLTKLEEISKKLDATSSKVDETNRRMEGMLSPIDDIKVRIRGGEAMEAQI